MRVLVSASRRSSSCANCESESSRAPMTTMRSPLRAKLTNMSPQAPVWKSAGFSPAPLDFANNIVAADATVDRAAEINGFGHDQNILIAQPACEAAYQGIPHQTNRPVAMGLKHHQQAAGERVQRFERGRYLVGIVSKIVDHGGFICGTHDLQSPTDATELA